MWLFTFFSYVTTNHHRYHLAPLLRRAHVQQLLKEVVAEGVHHQLRELVAHLVVDHVHHLLGMLVQTLLQRAAAVVVARHLPDVPAVTLDVSVLPRGALQRLLAAQAGDSQVGAELLDGGRRCRRELHEGAGGFWHEHRL